jgi:hypothetical protein
MRQSSRKLLIPHDPLLTFGTRNLGFGGQASISFRSGGQGMKTSSLLALLFVGAVIYYVTGGGSLFGLARPTRLPDTITPPNGNFVGYERTNPYAD